MFVLLAAIAIASLRTCQAAPGDVDSRIVNGTDTDIKDHPYMISLQLDGSHWCGGSIIDKYNILTAAHCFEDMDIHTKLNISRFTVLAGTTSITKNDRWLMSVERAFIHESFIDDMPFSNDIALVHLAEPLEFNENVQPIQLPKAFEPIPELSTAVLTGWGLNSSTNGDLQETLQEVNITVYSDSQCEILHAETGPTSRITHVCAGIPEGGKGQCSGDSGGPLVFDGTQIGIVSWSIKPCAREGYPGVFTKVSTYIDFLNCNLKRE
ncbi:chymotrypsin-1-like [Anoplophora glabripennis]|uniref:chymotrypsin-1-like n=1 Tax=Anoplophora glabripennis TaxID=217634 RepID=UPI000873A49C|nr:chymotrypsin-1-like [Anoplophora glabripennis]